MLTKFEHPQADASLNIVFFDEQTLHAVLEQAQTTQIAVDKLLANYYLVLTANGEIYDDFGEKVSLEKIRTAVANKGNLVQKCAENSNEDLIDAYRRSAAAKYTNTAALVKIKSAQSSFNPQQFSVTSCSIFSVERVAETTENNAEKSAKESSCCVM